MSSSLVATLCGHKGRVVKIAWSPRQDGLLLSTSYDGTSQVKLFQTFEVRKYNTFWPFRPGM